MSTMLITQCRRGICAIALLLIVSGCQKSPQQLFDSIQIGQPLPTTNESWKDAKLTGLGLGYMDVRHDLLSTTSLHIRALVDEKGCVWAKELTTQEETAFGNINTIRLNYILELRVPKDFWKAQPSSSAQQGVDKLLGDRHQVWLASIPHMPNQSTSAPAKYIPVTSTAPSANILADSLNTATWLGQQCLTSDNSLASSNTLNTATIAAKQKLIYLYALEALAVSADSGIKDITVTDQMEMTKNTRTARLLAQYLLAAVPVGFRPDLPSDDFIQAGMLSIPVLHEQAFRDYEIDCTCLSLFGETPGLLSYKITHGGDTITISQTGERTVRFERIRIVDAVLNSDGSFSITARKP